jgi:DHA3 family macrolide efflux protein-like MFS transporter
MHMQSRWARNLAIFLGAQTISLFGTSIVQYAIMWYVTLETESGAMMTIYIICGFLPTFFMTPFAGVWADRLNRKTIILLSDSFIALVTLILALVFLAGYSSIWMLFVFVALRAIGTGIQTPVIGAILPQIVPEDKLTKANAYSASIQSFIMLLAPMASAALLSVSTIERIFFIDVGTALIAVLALLLFLQVAPRENTEESQATGYFADLRNGLRYIANHGYLKRFFLFVALFVFLAAPASFLTPLQVVRSFGGGEWRLMAIEIAFSVGMMAGGGILAAWGGFRNRIHTMTAACLLFGLMTLLFGVLPNFWLYLAAMAVAGLSMPLFNTPATVLLQEKVQGEYLGRVFGVMGMIGSSVMPMAMLLFGPIADAFEIEWLLIATGVMLLALSFMLIGSRNLVEAGKARTAP